MSKSEIPWIFQDFPKVTEFHENPKFVDTIISFIVSTFTFVF